MVISMCNQTNIQLDDETNRNFHRSSTHPVQPGEDLAGADGVLDRGLGHDLGDVRLPHLLDLVALQTEAEGPRLAQKPRPRHAGVQLAVVRFAGVRVQAVPVTKQVEYTMLFHF